MPDNHSDQTPQLPADLHAAYIRAMRELQDAPVIDLELQPVDAWLLVSTIQAALRHPKFPRYTARAVEEIARALQHVLSKGHPTAGQLLELGWHAEFDVDVTSDPPTSTYKPSPERFIRPIGGGWRHITTRRPDNG